MQVNEILGNEIRRDPEKAPQLYGIEIEVENFRVPAKLGYWNRVEDGSLRNHGTEFITRPITLPDAEAAILEYYEQHAKNGYTTSTRTGTHVHMDMRNRTMKQVSAIAAAYTIVEPILFSRYCGPDREQSIFCVPWYRATNDVAVLREASIKKDVRMVRRALDRSCKYSALYVQPLRRFGTIEFRAAPTFDRAENLIEWVHVLTRLVNFASQADAQELVDVAENQMPTLVSALTGTAPNERELASLRRWDTLGTAAPLVRGAVREEWVAPTARPVEFRTPYHARDGQHDEIPMQGLPEPQIRRALPDLLVRRDDRPF